MPDTITPDQINFDERMKLAQQVGICIGTLKNIKTDLGYVLIFCNEVNTKKVIQDQIKYIDDKLKELE